MTITHFNAKLYVYDDADGLWLKPRKPDLELSRTTAATFEDALSGCLAKLRALKRFKDRRLQITVTPCETLDRGGHKLELALAARTEFVICDPSRAAA